jgi:hypothetical protein
MKDEKIVHRREKQRILIYDMKSSEQTNAKH